MNSAEWEEKQKKPSGMKNAKEAVWQRMAKEMGLLAISLAEEAESENEQKELSEMKNADLCYESREL